MSHKKFSTAYYQWEEMLRTAPPKAEPSRSPEARLQLPAPLTECVCRVHHLQPVGLGWPPPAPL